MRYLLAVILLLSASTVYAGEDILSACTAAFQIEQYRAQCIQNLSQRQAVLEQSQLQSASQIEAARMQANGLAAFGSGRALINGMNQGFRMMEVHPYVLPPVQPIPVR